MNLGLLNSTKTAEIVGFWHENWADFKSLVRRTTGYAQMVQQQKALCAVVFSSASETAYASSFPEL
jgi:hypothetical protein